MGHFIGYESLEHNLSAVGANVFYNILWIIIFTSYKHGYVIPQFHAVECYIGGIITSTRMIMTFFFPFFSFYSFLILRETKRFQKHKPEVYVDLTAH